MFERQIAEVKATLIAKQCRYHKRKFKKSCKDCKIAQSRIKVGKELVRRYKWLARMSL